MGVTLGTQASSFRSTPTLKPCSMATKASSLFQGVPKTCSQSCLPGLFASVVGGVHVVTIACSSFCHSGKTFYHDGRKGVKGVMGTQQRKGVRLEWRFLESN